MKDYILKEVTYKNQQCLIVYVIPEFDRKGRRQVNELSYYLSYPLNKIVGKSELFYKSK